MTTVEMEQLKHFSHEHLLNLVQLQPDHDNANSDEEDEDKDDIAVEEVHIGECNMCNEEIYSFHLGYYSCKDCDYNLHRFCAQLPESQQNHPLHSICVACSICKNEQSPFYKYVCSICSWFKIHLDCALLPAKLLIQQSTNESFSHSHLLNLVHSFPYIEQKAKFFPKCRVCVKNFPDINIWLSRCNKCRYYVHIDCATSRKEAFMCSILMPVGQGKTHINFKVEDHPNLIRYPFPDESVNLVMHHFIKKGEKAIKEKIAGEMFSHPHPLILVDTLLNGSISLHDPMKKVELLCDGCVRPITDVPFYKCCQQDCDFVLHEWCTRLPSEIQHHPCHHP